MGAPYIYIYDISRLRVNLVLLHVAAKSLLSLKKVLKQTFMLISSFPSSHYS
jgi:hypothetical protein